MVLIRLCGLHMAYMCIKRRYVTMWPVAGGHRTSQKDRTSHTGHAKRTARFHFAMQSIEHDASKHYYDPRTVLNYDGDIISD